MKINNKEELRGILESAGISPVLSRTTSKNTFSLIYESYNHFVFYVGCVDYDRTLSLLSNFDNITILPQ